MSELYYSYEEVRLEKARVNGLVQLADAQVSALSFTPANNQIRSNWNAFYAQWQSFFSTGTDQDSLLWFPNFPDNQEWNVMQQYEQQLSSLQAQINQASGISNAVVQPSGTGGTVIPQIQSTLTTVAWIVGVAAVVYLFGPLIQSESVALARRA